MDLYGNTGAAENKGGPVAPAKAAASDEYGPHLSIAVWFVAAAALIFVLKQYE